MSEPKPEDTFTTSGPPPRPWEKGVHPDYSCCSVEVVLAEDSSGTVWSEHRLSHEDAAISAQLSGGGARQIAHALLTEALRREVFVDVLVQMSKGDGFLDWYGDAAEDQKREIEQNMANAGLAVLVTLLPRMLPGIAREVLEMVSVQAAETQTT